MQKNVLGAVAAVSLLAIACSNGSGGMSATAKKNKEVNDSIMKAYENNNFDRMKDYIAADAVDHGGETGDIKGVDNIISEMKRYRAMVTDMKSKIISEMADDEYVITWSDFSATMDGHPINMKSVDVSRFKDGKAVEHWVYMDPKDVMAMQQPPAGNGGGSAPMSDTTHH